MAATRAEIGRFVMMFLVGALVGLLVGEVLVRLVPELSILRASSRPIGFDLAVLAVRMHFNLAALIGGLGFAFFLRR